jgi:hypothetical protein
MMSEQANASGLPPVFETPSLPPPAPQDGSAGKPESKFRLRYTQKPAKLGALDSVPRLGLSPLAAAPPPLAGAALLTAAAVERLVTPNSGCYLFGQAEPELPAFAIQLPNAAPAGGPAHEEWMRSPAAAPAERFSTAHGAAVVAFPGFSALQPVMGCLALADPICGMVPDARRTIPEPRVAEPVPRTAGPLRTVAIVAPGAHRPAQGGYFPDGPEAAAPALPEAEGARSLATPAYGRTPAAFPMRLPRLGDPAPNQGLPAAPFAAPLSRPAARAGVPRQIPRAPVSTLTIRAPQQPEPAQPAALHLAELMPLEYFCSRGPRTVAHGMGWIIPTMALTAPRFAAPLSVERVEPLPEAPKTKRKRPAFAEIFTLPEAAGRRSTLLRDLSKMIAACLVIGALLWYGVSYIRSNHDAVMGSLSDDNGRNLSAYNSPAVRANPDVEGGGLVNRVRSAISRRAEVRMGDSFQNGMAAWGVPSQSWAPGWARHAEGYVTPGKLALFQPTLGYTDYRLEFFGQIESKSLNWAVRASDDANYYAMKFSAVGPARHAVMTMIHYPVVAGKKGPRTATPLNFALLEHTPYHVAVDVRGDQVTTSIEGRQIDTFVDRTLARGGVGFFAEAGEQARLYWIKVSKNEDWLGRVCAFLSGGDSAIAQLAPPAGSLPSPDSGAPGPSGQLALAAGFGLTRRNAFSRLSDYRRFSSCRS